MKRLLLASALSALSLTPALAADVVAPIASVYDWSGFYVGLQAGYGWSRVDQPYASVGGPFIFTQDDADGNGWLGGAHVGYNKQFDSWVLGLEGDFEASNIDGDDGGSGGHINGFEFKWLGSVRGRVGYALDRVLLYGTGGYAFMRGSAYAVEGFGGATAESNSATFHGWTIGTGAEYAFTDNLTARVEYRYTDFGAKRISFPVNGYDEKIDPSFHAVRLGVSYKF
ncbi:MAG: porin family protein [Mesorhizobium sp.]|nr:MAG: porin family protein [Mesorhizobium sp.]